MIGNCDVCGAECELCHEEEEDTPKRKITMQCKDCGKQRLFFNDELYYTCGSCRGQMEMILVEIL